MNNQVISSQTEPRSVSHSWSFHKSPVKYPISPQFSSPEVLLGSPCFQLVYSRGLPSLAYTHVPSGETGSSCIPNQNTLSPLLKAQFDTSEFSVASLGSNNFPPTFIQKSLASFQISALLLKQYSLLPSFTQSPKQKSRLQSLSQHLLTRDIIQQFLLGRQELLITWCCCWSCGRCCCRSCCWSCGTCCHWSSSRCGRRGCNS